MRKRGDVYWNWADPRLHTRTHEETLENGKSIDVQVRLSRLGGTQMFIGVYSYQGLALFEQAYDSRPHETMTRAMAWGVGLARAKAEDLRDDFKESDAKEHHR